MTTIAPSLLSANFLSLEEDIKRFDGIKDLWLHLDIMDGHFVPNLTFGHTVLKDVQEVTSHKLDAHLMVSNPEQYIESYKNIGVYNFTFHWEAVTHHDRLISELKNKFSSVGIALNPSTPVSIIPEYILSRIDLILIMTVNPGFGGQSFIQECIQKISTLSKLRNEKNYKFQIQVDGGVNNLNSKTLIENGANNLVAGSYIFNEPNKNYIERVKSLRE